MVVVLDSGPLGLVTNPRSSPEAEECSRWLESLLEGRTDVIVPEIIDYEIRRELLHADKALGVERLNQFIRFPGYLPITTAVMRRAAHWGASPRKLGKPTAAAAALDVDMILCAQAAGLAEGGFDPIIATAKVRAQMFWPTGPGQGAGPLDVY